MVFLKVILFATMTVFAVGAPVNEAQSYSSFSSGYTQSHAPVALAHAPLVTSHATTLLSHAPVALHHAPEVEHYAPAHYEFKYGVNDQHTHDIKEQAEKRVGDKVEGYYTLLEPDGTTRTVHYTADKHTGFNAVVSRSGHASHPTKVAVPVHKVVSAPVVSYAHAAPVVSYAHAAPVVSYAHTAPVVSYAHAAPVLSYSQAPSQSHGSATSYSSFSSLGH